LTAAHAITYADRSGDDWMKMSTATTHADSVHSAGQREQAERLFADAEWWQKGRMPAHPLLFSLWGYRYCDLLLAKGDYASTRRRVTQIISEWNKQEYDLLSQALDLLALGRAQLGVALEYVQRKPLPTIVRDDTSDSHTRLGNAIDGLRAAGALEFIAHGLLARAAFCRSVSDWDGAARDLDEVEEIAEPGPMRLFLCDMALERARLAFARSEAFAPLNGLIDDSPPKPERPGEAECKRLQDEAEKQLAIAADYIEKCGYHRRDEELAELQAVRDGKRTFASLPPRV
jgi:hypothetical protein